MLYSLILYSWTLTVFHMLLFYIKVLLFLYLDLIGNPLFENKVPCVFALQLDRPGPGTTRIMSSVRLCISYFLNTVT